MRSYVSYLRVSTNRQGQSGLGLVAQQSAVSAYVRSQGGNLIQEFLEVESGAKASRPVLRDALDHCRRNRHVLLIAKLDRLARNVAFISSLMESGVEFVAADAPYANKLMLHILAAFAEHEREQISLRTKQALAAAKARGVRLGTFGAVLADRNREAAVAFAETCREHLVQISDLNQKTLSQIANELNERGVQTAEGGQWHSTTVARVMRRLGLERACASRSDQV